MACPLHTGHLPAPPQLRKIPDADIEIWRHLTCNVMDIRLVLLSHNLGRGAAGAAILNAELLTETGYITRRDARNVPLEQTNEPSPSALHA